jgi:hypothetical protein
MSHNPMDPFTVCYRDSFTFYFLIGIWHRIDEKELAGLEHKADVKTNKKNENEPNKLHNNKIYKPEQRLSFCLDYYPPNLHPGATSSGFPVKILCTFHFFCTRITSVNTVILDLITMRIQGEEHEICSFSLHYFLSLWDVFSL